MKRLTIALLVLASCGSEQEEYVNPRKYTIVFSDSWTSWWDSTDYYEIDTITNFIHYRDQDGDSTIRSMKDFDRININH